MAKVGRPSKFEGVNLKQVEKVARKGWTDDEMADFFDVSRSTWSLWKVEHEEFSDALKEWKEEADERVERSLYERACGYSHKEDKIFNDNGEPLIVPTVKHYPPDTTAAIFWLKNRKKEEWRDKQDHNHQSEDGSMTPKSTVDVSKLSNAALAEILAASKEE